jgi:hypothetical protein
MFFICNLKCIFNAIFIIACFVLQKKREARAIAAGLMASNPIDRIVMKDLRIKLANALNGRTRGDFLLEKANAEAARLRTDYILLEARCSGIKSAHAALKDRAAIETAEWKLRVADKTAELSILRATHAKSETRMQQKIDDLLALLRIRESTIASHAAGSMSGLTAQTPGSVYHFSFGANAVVGAPHSTS